MALLAEGVLLPQFTINMALLAVAEGEPGTPQTINTPLLTEGIRLLLGLLVFDSLADGVHTCYRLLVQSSSSTTKSAMVSHQFTHNVRG